jgi:hypothetical protein
MNIKDYIESQQDIDDLSIKLSIMCGRNMVKQLTQEELTYLIMIKTAVIMDILTMQAQLDDKLDELSLMDMTATVLLGMMVKLNTDCNKSLKDIFLEYSEK